jgi:hypothetical protein
MLEGNALAGGRSAKKRQETSIHAMHRAQHVLTRVPFTPNLIGMHLEKKYRSLIAFKGLHHHVSIHAEQNH